MYKPRFRGKKIDYELVRLQIKIKEEYKILLKMKLWKTYLQIISKDHCFVNFCKHINFIIIKYAFIKAHRIL